VLSPKNIKGKWQLALENFDRAHYFKFVAADIRSLEEINLFVQDNAIPKQKVYIMPMGATREEQLSRMQMVFTFCAEHGYRMSPRLHILVFGEKRGV
jgi:7-carboxy-7-deazaguanine synthase